MHTATTRVGALSQQTMPISATVAEVQSPLTKREYKKLLADLSADLGVDLCTLQRTVTFFRTYKRSATPPSALPVAASSANNSPAPAWSSSTPIGTIRILARFVFAGGRLFLRACFEASVHLRSGLCVASARKARGGVT